MSPLQDRRWLVIEWGMFVGTLLLFTYNVLAWRGLFGGPFWHPRRSLVFSGALVLQALVPLTRRWAPPLWPVALGAWAVAIIFVLVLAVR
jgi:hypothetical protein